MSNDAKYLAIERGEIGVFVVCKESCESKARCRRTISLFSIGKNCSSARRLKLLKWATGFQPRDIFKQNTSTIVHYSFSQRIISASILNAAEKSSRRYGLSSFNPFAAAN